MNRIVAVLLLLAITVAAALLIWRYTSPKENPHELVLHGNVDLRQVSLAFNNNERIAAVLVQEGDRVKRGQVLAKLDTSRLEPQVAQAEALAAAQRAIVERLHNGSRKEEIAQAKAQTAAQSAEVDKLHHGSRAEEIAQAKAQTDVQRHIVERLHNGSRPEEIAQARSTLESAKSDAANARIQFDRLNSLLNNPAGQAASKQDVDNARTALETANDRVAVAQKSLDLSLLGPRKEEVAENDARLSAAQSAQDLIVTGPRKEDIAEAEAKLAANQAAQELAIEGPRKEDIAEAEARLRGDEAQVAYSKQILADAQLIAPSDAVVRTRVLEPGEMASPQRPVFTLAITDPKWVRAYVSEPDLGKVRSGMAATVSVDSFPGKRFEGWVGFLSPVAEFTPKDVQTEELRTSLVYEVRVFVKDPGDDLRLGMPATVTLALDANAPQTSPAATPEHH
ncbi:MAG TPA: efflux RND transporter periplasmic adaptor subunit [Planctomycetota bacterium]|nr:efflux RND transporter periplasmic adaptor subunit [Planctomycetota bacterium]